MALNCPLFSKICLRQMVNKSWRSGEERTCGAWYGGESGTSRAPFRGDSSVARCVSAGYEAKNRLESRSGATETERKDMGFCSGIAVCVKLCFQYNKCEYALCCKPRLSVAPESGLQSLSIGYPALTHRASELPPVGTGFHIRRLRRR